jgi:serine/threonine protein kinase
MEYLHTMFESGDNSHGQPIIHRDLKSPNLLLATRPMEGEGVLVKVTDFGLSRDKALSAVNADHAATVMMTGCGSILWMAPEILMGESYNEKVDVFSFAMCLVELVDCGLPWSREGMYATAAEVPMKVTRGMRPRKQLEGTEDSPLDPQIVRLIRDCWSQKPDQRPDFTTVRHRLEEMMGIGTKVKRGSGNPSSNSSVESRASNGKRRVSRESAPGILQMLEPLLEAAEGAPDVTRPSSPEVESDLERKPDRGGSRSSVGALGVTRPTSPNFESDLETEPPLSGPE